MGKLTAGFVDKLKATDKNRRYSDGDGLSLMVRPNGSKPESTEGHRWRA